MRPPELDLIPDNRREILEKWLAYCGGENPDESEFEHFIHTEASPEELRVFFSPFDCADELLARLKRTHTLQPEPAGEEVLISALKHYVAEMARNSDVLDEPDLAEQLRSITTFRRVQSVADEKCGDDVEDLDMYYEDMLSDAIIHEVCSSASPAGALYGVTHRWFGMQYLREYFLQPLLAIDLDFTVYFAMLSVGGMAKIHGNEAIVSPWFSLDSDQSPPSLILKSRADKEAARAGVDWSDLPTASPDIEALRAAGQDGDHPSMAKLSLMYIGGIGVDYDYRAGIDTLEKAAGDYPSVVQCFEAAAERGFSPAMYLLGYNFMDSHRGVKEDHAKAEKWLLKAADAGVAGAPHMLYCLYKRRGALQDPVKAFHWLKVNADKGDGRVTHQNLGLAYEQGTGTEVDNSAAYTAFYLAARQNPQDPPSELAYMERVAQFLTPEEITEATERAEAWIHADGRTAEGFDNSDGRPFVNPATQI